MGHMPARWLTTALAFTSLCLCLDLPLSLASKFVEVLFGWRSYLGDRKPPMNHLEMSHPRSRSDDSLTDVSLVLSSFFFFFHAFGFALNTFPMSHCCEQMQDYTCACFAHSLQCSGCTVNCELCCCCCCCYWMKSFMKSPNC